MRNNQSSTMTRRRDRERRKVVMPDMVDRLGQIENQVGQLEASSEHFERETSRNFAALFQAVNEIKQELSHRNKTDWSSLGTWSGVLLVIVGMWTLPLKESLVALADEADSSRTRLSAIETRVSVMEALIGERHANQ